MNYREWIWPVITHTLVAIVFFTAALFAFAALAIGGAIDKCGTDTNHLIAQSVTGGKVGVNDSVCDWAAPGHNIQVYRISPDGTHSESVAHYSTNSFLMPYATWTHEGELVIEVPRALSLSTDPYVQSDAIIKFRQVR